jgi:hypothetical protein
MMTRLFLAGFLFLTLIFMPLRLEAEVPDDASPAPAEEASLLEAGNLISVKRYAEALAVLEPLSESPGRAGLRLTALRFKGETEEFFRYASTVLDRYPRETGLVRVFLEYLNAERKEGLNPGPRERGVLDLILRRLSVLVPLDAELAWMAAPFVRDTEDARRMVLAYRAVNKVVPASLPVALNLGVIAEETALEELFAPGVQSLDKALLEEIWSLLRDNTRRVLFGRNLSDWSGVITEDTNGDGIAEATGVYRGGFLSVYTWDADQDGAPELALYFEAGDPRTAVARISSTGAVAGQDRVIVEWEEFPAVREAQLGNERFIPRPMEFFYAPVKFREIYGTELLFPGPDPLTGSLSRRLLAAASMQVVRPSKEISGAEEIIELARNIPIRAREYLNGSLVSETDFLRGRPLVQRIDLDLDGRLETVRHFRRFVPPAFGAEIDDPAVLLDYAFDIDYADSDWDGDGVFEIREYTGKE